MKIFSKISKFLIILQNVCEKIMKSNNFPLNSRFTDGLYSVAESGHTLFNRENDVISRLKYQFQYIRPAVEEEILFL